MEPAPIPILEVVTGSVMEPTNIRVSKVLAVEQRMESLVSFSYVVVTEQEIKLPVPVSRVGATMNRWNLSLQFQKSFPMGWTFLFRRM